MPAEVKNIIFSHEEVFNAINLFEGVNTPKLTNGKILSISAEPDDKENLCVNFLSYGRNIERQFLISYANFGAILLSYCIRHKIPMARKASKSIRMMGDHVSLELIIGAQNIPLDTVA
jgi:hypothetical protein